MTQETEGQAPAPAAPVGDRQQAAIEKFAETVAEEALAEAVEGAPAEPEAPAQLGQATPAAPAAPAVEAAPVAPTPTRQDEIKARIAAERAKRQAEAPTPSPVDAEAIKAAIKAELAAQPGNEEAVIAKFLADMDRDPVATMEKYKRDPRSVLTKLSEDMIRRGSVRQASEANDAAAEAKRAREDAAQLRAEIAAEREQARLDAIHTSYMTSAGSAERAPLLSKLSPERREKLGLAKWRELSEDLNGQWNEGIVIDAIEADLSDLQAVLAPSQPPVTTGTGRAAKAPPQTLTADLAAQSSGRERVRTREDKVNDWVQRQQREALEEARSKKAARQA